MPIFRSLHHKYDFVGRGPRASSLTTHDVVGRGPRASSLTTHDVVGRGPRASSLTTFRGTSYPRCCTKTCASHSSHVGF